MIGKGLPAGPWAAELREATSHFHQGFVIDGQPFAYAVNANYPIWAATRKAIETAGTQDLVAVRDYFPFAMIVSQTCDVCDEGKRIPKQPWVTVAPTYNIAPDVDLGQQKQIRRGDITYLFPLTSPEFVSADSLWVVDLRLEYPIEKGRLINANSRRGFASDADSLAFGVFLAERRNRPAVGESIRTYILTPLAAALDSGTIPEGAIQEVRLRAEPSLIEARLATVYLVVGDEDDVVALQEAVADVYQAISAGLPDTLTLMDIKVATPAILRYDEMRSTVRVALDGFRA